MLPVVQWYAAGSGAPATIANLRPQAGPSTGGLPVRRLLGHGLIRLGRAVRGNAARGGSRLPRAALAR